MKEIPQVGDIVEINGEIHLIQDVVGELMALKLSRASGFIVDIPDTTRFITSLDYLKRSVDQNEIKYARKTIEESGHDIQYLGDGVFVIDRDTAKASYCIGAKLIQMADTLQKEKEEKAIRKGKGGEKKRKTEKVRKNKDTKENKEFWDSVEKTSKEVEDTYPDWKKGGNKIRRETNDTKSPELRKRKKHKVD